MESKKYLNESLIEAALKGNLTDVERLHAQGADLLYVGEDETTTAFHYAACYGRLPVLQYIVEQGIGINVADKDGMTMLHLAALSGHLECVKYLVEKGADIHAKNTFGEKPIHGAAKNGHVECLEYLAKKASSKELRDSFFQAVEECQVECMLYLLKNGVEINTKDEDGLTPLHYAVSFRNYSAIKFLIEQGASVNEKDHDGKIPLDFAGNDSRQEIGEFMTACAEEKQLSGFIHADKFQTAIEF